MVDFVRFLDSLFMLAKIVLYILIVLALIKYLKHK